MKLLEVVRGKSTEKEVLATAMALGKKLGKVTVLAGNGFGFIGNRMVLPYLREAYFLLEEGASVEEVNQALVDFGMAMGPLAMDDLAGLDVMRAIREAGKHLDRAGARKPLVADMLYAQGRYGQKTGRGWSSYDAKRTSSADPEVVAVIEKAAAENGIARRKIEPAEIVDRCIYALVNEGARLLEEGIALRSVDIDVTYIYGYGFPAWRGGPMFYSGSVGLRSVLARLEEFGRTYGRELWEPAPLLMRLGEGDETFEDFDAANEKAPDALARR